jgi:putative transposase
MSQDGRCIHKNHNVTVLIYHIVSSAKYRRIVFTDDVDRVLLDVCDAMELRYEFRFLEIGTDNEYVHFLVQSIPSYSVSKLVRTVKSLIAREVFQRCPEVKKQLWGGEFWGKGYFVNTVGQHGTEQKIASYVKNQGLEKEYVQLKTDHQIKLF